MNDLVEEGEVIDSDGKILEIGDLICRVSTHYVMRAIIVRFETDSLEGIVIRTLEDNGRIGTTRPEFVRGLLSLRNRWPDLV